MLAIRSATALALLLIASACATLPTTPSETASATSRSSWCLGDLEIPYRTAPADDFDDTGNLYTDDPTRARIAEHNARLRAACPKEKKE